ncbi:MAG: FAD-dependent oxidoreductase [Pseudomonadota bacterium]|nr:FAD-dependent oxidoreductase [Pseudomonadota bacterium]
MSSAPSTAPLYIRTAREAPPSRQDTLAARYPAWVRWLAMGAFALAFLGWFNESWLFLWDSPIWLNRYTEYAIILGFGLWRIHAERNSYTRRRLIILVSVVTAIWWLIPWLTPFFEPYFGYLWAQPVFPALHTPGTLTFLLVLALVFLFGRRVICGFGCPCVGIRETVGFAWRGRTLRGTWIWRLRHVKWLFFVWYVAVMVATQYPPTGWTVTLVGMFGLTVGLTYFGSFFLVPMTGNRFYCRYLCPYGATFGLLNHAGFYDVTMDKERCVDCRRCEQACDMGIPVWKQGKAHGRVTGLEDCMGCARCVVACPTDALALRDVRDHLWPGRRRDASRLLGQAPVTAAPRVEPVARAMPERLADWSETCPTLDVEAARVQAARCLDCGVPGCRNACPLANPIPDWLAAVAAGDWTEAAERVHVHSALPEVCARLCPQERLCEGACARTGMEGAVTIGAIERIAAEQALATGWRPSAPRRRNGRRVAVVGAGPAGLACAERLNQAGVRVSVFERGPTIGGLLASGVPGFKLDNAVLARRRTLLEKTGIRFHCNSPVDGTLLAELLQDHDAVFLGLGAQRPRSVELPGLHLPGVDQALAWLAAANAGQREDLAGRTLLVLGGGDTAIDCARVARRLGAQVILAYRGPETRLRATPKEVALAREEGVELRFDLAPEAFLGGEHLAAVRFAGGAELAAERAIIAFGQQPDPPPWLADLDVAIETDGRIRVDGDGRTSHPRIFAGGDNTHGPDLAVTAMAAGRRAAEAILADGARRLALPRRAAGVVERMHWSAAG